MQKRLKKILRLVFGRTMITLLFLLIQIFILFVIVTQLSQYYELFYTISLVLSVISIVYIINDKSNTSFKMAWIIPVMSMPVFGTLLYIFVKLELGTKLVNRKLKELINETKPLMEQNVDVLNELMEKDAREADFVRYMNNYAFFPVYDNTSAKYFSLGESKFETMLEELRKAEKFIFMEYFIIEEGVMWNAVLEILKQKVKEGVEVRIMYDGTCSIMLLPNNYPKKLEKFGIKCKVFSPIKPILTTVQNNRDHRKILVIDGKIAFTGGINIADEYINYKDRFGHWKDTAIMISGKGVKSFTLMFLQNWNITGTKPDNYSDYIIEDYEPVFDIPNKGYVIPYSDSPLDNECVGQNVYIEILFRATNYVHIMTPYLILDDEMQNALIFAAKRGVETVIIMPHIPDKKYAYYLARTYYEELIIAGVKIYEYTPGFMHAKVFVSDDIRAVVGSINLDYRSLFLHFECAAYLYANDSISDIEADYMDTLAKCQEITLEDCHKLGMFKKFFGRVLRLIAPLM